MQLRGEKNATENSKNAQWMQLFGTISKRFWLIEYPYYRKTLRVKQLICCLKVCQGWKNAEKCDFLTINSCIMHNATSSKNAIFDKNKDDPRP